MEIDKDKLKYIEVEEGKYLTTLTAKFEARKPWAPADPKKMKTLLPGTISKIFVEKGATVKKGDSILILEAMKMKNQIIATRSGKIKKIHVEAGQIVAKDDLLIEYEK